MTTTSTSAPLVSVIILSWNCQALLPRAVESALAQTYRPVEVVIVDNASTDGTAEVLARFEPVATVVRQEENSGFARGMNAGYDAARGDVCVLLNCDAVLPPDFVAAAVAHFARDPGVGVIGANIWRIARAGEWRFWQRPQPWDLPFDGGVVALDPLLRVVGLTDGGVPWQPTFKANGAVPVVRRAVIEEMRLRFGAAPFDPVFDTYGEDVDFAFKAWALGWRTMFAADVVAGHVRSYSSELDMWDKRGRLRVNLIAERYINAARHLPPARLLAVLAVALATDAWRAMRRQLAGDREAYPDLRAALTRLLRMRQTLERFRRAHATWRAINVPEQVFLRSAPGKPYE